MWQASPTRHCRPLELADNIAYNVAVAARPRNFHRRSAEVQRVYCSSNRGRLVSKLKEVNPVYLQILSSTIALLAKQELQTPRRAEV